MATVASPESTVMSLTSEPSPEPLHIHESHTATIDWSRRIVGYLNSLGSLLFTRKTLTIANSLRTFVRKVMIVSISTAAFSAMAFCQLNSNSASVLLTATLAESLSISVTPSSVNVPLIAGGVGAESNPIMVTTSWILARSRTEVDLYGYFANPEAALTDGSASPVNIPTSAVFGQMPSAGLTSFLPFTYDNPIGPAGGSLRLWGQLIGDTNYSVTRTDTLYLQIDLSNQPDIPAGSFTGTLILQAQAL